MYTISQEYSQEGFCRPFQSWKGSSQPEALYRSAPKLVPASSRGQLCRRHRSYGSSYRQSNIDSQSKRKDSPIHAEAFEPGDVFYAQEDEEKIAYLAPIEAYIYYYYHVQSPQDSAVKAWLIDPYT